MENAGQDAALYKDTVFVPEMGVHPPEGKQENIEKQEIFEVENEVYKFIEDEKLKVLLV